DFLSEKNLYHSEVIPLYARLSVGAQQKAFKLGQRRRIILSTNVAETSVTVPGVHCVIDTGKARISRYSYRSKVQHLPIEPISKASARQRTGRAGRIAPGICIRLYSEADFLARPDYTEPEILRTNLAAVILKMKVERLGAIENFPFLDPPDTRYIKDGYRLLHELQALDERNQLLPIGRAMSYWQVEPRLARMIVAAKDHGVLREILIIASFLSVPDPRERPREAMKQADEAHQRFWLPGSDFLTILNLWDQSRGYSNTKLKDFCHSNFLSFLRMREWQDIHQQLLDQAIRLNWKINEKSEGEYADISIHRAILTGLLSHIAEWNEEKRYRGARHVEWHLHPGSSLFKTPPKWIGAYEVVETGRCYARTVAKIDPEWLESAAAHLIKKSYSEPHWQDRAGYVAAFLKISLYGLEIIPKRRINYGPIDPIAAREVFIREALVAGRFQSQAEFYRHNQSLREELSEWEDKARRQDILVSDEKLYEFYESRIHTSVYDGPSFKKWWSGLSNEALQILKLRPEDLIESASIQGEQYPDEWIDGALTLPLVYHFAPGEPDDGVTVVVPQSLLNQLQPEPLEWGVPGLLEEKIEALIRSLPKPLRRACIPVSNYAHACVMACESIDRHARLLQTIAETLSRLTVKIEADDFDPTTLEPHLIMNIRVVDEAGKVLGEGRDLSALKARFAVELEIERYLPESWKKSNRTDWDFGTLPASKELFVQGVKFNLFPTFEDHGASVALNWIEDQSMAEEGIHIGVRRLLFLACASQRSALRLNAPEWDEAVRFYRNLAKESEARDDIALHIVNRVFGGDYRAIRSQDAFEALLA
ncbi:MAG: ATP-dependent RNA helicase HrpA, partial [Gammaproteobacteria bacterium]|nr:ATP-dependent RNA helicase HrpA [Gammaproteobacteria bacterium]